LIDSELLADLDFLTGAILVGRDWGVEGWRRGRWIERDLSEEPSQGRAVRVRTRLRVSVAVWEPVSTPSAFGNGNQNAASRVAVAMFDLIPLDTVIPSCLDCFHD
jgi:hypothetical protein